MTAKEKLWSAFYDNIDGYDYSLHEGRLDKELDAIIEEAENAAVAAALADVVRLLRHCGKPDTAARLIHSLQADREKVRKGHETAFPALRAAVPLPA